MFRETHCSTYAPSCTDNNSLDAIRSYHTSTNSSVYLKNKIQDLIPPDMDDCVNIVSYNKVGDVIEDIDTSYMDDMGIPLDLSDDLLHMVMLLL